MEVISIGIKAIYAKNVQEFCFNKVNKTLCTRFNLRHQSELIKISIYAKHIRKTVSLKNCFYKHFNSSNIF